MSAPVAGSGILAVDRDPDLPDDLLLGFVACVRRRWGRRVIVDHRGREWCRVRCVPPDGFCVVWAVYAGVRYPAVRLQGHSRPSELRHAGRDVPVCPLVATAWRQPLNPTPQPFNAKGTPPALPATSPIHAESLTLF
ncbi:hypothetical protein VZC37_01430 [Gordonia sp. LSe1-13]|uniref:Uncharacterized protein n=1 Tax=Gordonia sesuvii TaxID=3116777 RepID=A0ABU7M799_9ACTN|nr:hypothetical protein [Gordonia sp. LSe1-13]